METGNRFERDPAQQAQQARGDTVPSGQWSNPASSQGQGEDRQDYTEQSGDPYAQQARYGQAGYGAAGQQRSDDWGQGRADTGRTSDPSSTSAQYGGSERAAYGQTGGYQDPTTRRDWQGARDDDDTAGTAGEKPSVTSKVKGTAEKLAGKMTGDSGKQARGEERKEGLY